MTPLKTLKSLKAATIWNLVFCISCIVTILCIWLKSFALLGALSLYGWMINPMGIISCYRTWKAYREDRKIPMHKKTIGNRWIWIYLWPIITTILYFFCVGLFVGFTGGV